MNLPFAINEYRSSFNLSEDMFQSGVLFALLAALAASSKAVLVKLIYAEVSISPLELLFLRLILALPFFILLAFWPRLPRDQRAPVKRPPLTWQNWLLVFWLGFSGYYFASLTDFIGLSYISAGLERLVVFTYPTLVMLIEVIYRRRLPSKQTVVAVAICYLGLFAAFAHDLSQNRNSVEVVKGVLWVGLSALSFALYYLATGKALLTLGVRRLTGLAGIVATTICSLHFILVGDWQRLVDLPQNVWGLASLIAILCTILPSLLLTAAIKSLGPTQAANISAVGPVLTIFLAWWLLAEPLSIFQLVGMGLVVYGVQRMRHS